MLKTLAIAAALMLLGNTYADAQQHCVDTPEGRVCTGQQAIRAGQPVSVAEQRRLGLVTVNGGCSGTLLNRSWVLTARHCVQVDSSRVVPNSSALPLLQSNQVSVAATWTGRVAQASRLVELGVPNLRDIILIEIAGTDLGDAGAQRLYAAHSLGRSGPAVAPLRLQTTDVVEQYGRGYDTFATVLPNGTVNLATGLGTYRHGQFAPAGIDVNGYRLALNGNQQVGHGGDSGGPTIVMSGTTERGIAGVQSTCSPTAYAPGAPSPPTWPWALGISGCNYVSIEPVVAQIRDVINDGPQCRPWPGCFLPPVIHSSLD